MRQCSNRTDGDVLNPNNILCSLKMFFLSYYSGAFSTSLSDRQLVQTQPSKKDNFSLSFLHNYVVFEAE